MRGLNLRELVLARASLRYAISSEFCGSREVLEHQPAKGIMAFGSSREVLEHQPAKGMALLLP